MKSLVVAGRALLLDFASTIIFLILYALTRNILLSVGSGIALAIIQIGLRLFREQSVDAFQWISLIIIIASGSATLLSHNLVFVKLKPSAIYVMVGCAMLQRGWLLRYMPARAVELMSDLAIRFGYIWAGLMFFSALLNYIVATRTDIISWGLVLTAWGFASKLSLFLVQYGYMRRVGRKRHLAQSPSLVSSSLSSIA